MRIPDDLAARLQGAGYLPRRALEAFALEQHRAGRLTAAELQRLLGLGTRGELDGFLKMHGIFEDDTLADLERERKILDRSDVPAQIRAMRQGVTLGGLRIKDLIDEGRR